MACDPSEQKRIDLTCYRRVRNVMGWPERGECRLSHATRPRLLDVSCFPFSRHPALTCVHFFDAWDGTLLHASSAVTASRVLDAHLDTTEGQVTVAAAGPPPPSPSAHTSALLKPEITPEDMADEPESDGIISVISAVPPTLLPGLPPPIITVSLSSWLMSSPGCCAWPVGGKKPKDAATRDRCGVAAGAPALSARGVVGSLTRKDSIQTMLRAMPIYYRLE